MQNDEEVATRCETVLNTTMAEFEIYHDQKVEDFHGLTTDFLDSEITLYEQACDMDVYSYKSLSLEPRYSSVSNRRAQHSTSRLMMGLAIPQDRHRCTSASWRIRV